MSFDFFGKILVLSVSAERPFPNFAIGSLLCFLFLFPHLITLNLNRIVRRMFFLSFIKSMVSVSTVVSLNFNIECFYFVDAMLIPEFLS